MLFTLKSCFKYVFKRQTKYGIHSPFVFDLLTKGLHRSIDQSKWKLTQEYKQKLYNTEQIIEVEDFGAGSHFFNSNQRKVKDIAKIAGMSRSKAKLIFRLAEYFGFISVLELGTSLGIGTSVFKIALPDAQITTIEGCKNTQSIAEKYLKEFGFENINFVNGSFDKQLKPLLEKQDFELIYIDGHHTKQATLDYFETIKSFVKNDTLLIFDDIHWSQEMTDAWDMINSDSQVTVSIDLFYIGLIFFKEELSKQHFIL